MQLSNHARIAGRRGCEAPEGGLRWTTDESAGLPQPVDSSMQERPSVGVQRCHIHRESVDNSKRQYTRHFHKNRIARPDRYTPCHRTVVETGIVRSKHCRCRPDGTDPGVCCTKSDLLCNRSRTARKVTVRQVRAKALGSDGYLLEISRVPRWKVADHDLAPPALAIPANAAAHTKTRAATHHRSCPEFFDPNLWPLPENDCLNEC